MPIWVSRYSGDCPLESMINIINLEVNLHIVLRQSAFVAELSHCTLNNAATAAFQGQRWCLLELGKSILQRTMVQAPHVFNLKTAVSSPLHHRVLEWKQKGTRFHETDNGGWHENARIAGVNRWDWISESQKHLVTVEMRKKVRHVIFFLCRTAIHDNRDNCSLHALDAWSNSFLVSTGQSMFFSSPRMNSNLQERVPEPL